MMSPAHLARFLVKSTVRLTLSIFPQPLQEVVHALCDR